MSGPRVTEALRLGDTRRKNIMAAVRGCGGDLNVAAGLMKLSRATFNRYVDELNIGGEVRRLADRARVVDALEGLAREQDATRAARRWVPLRALRTVHAALLDGSPEAERVLSQIRALEGSGTIPSAELRGWARELGGAP